MGNMNTAEITSAGKPAVYWQFAKRALTPWVRVLMRFGFTCQELAHLIRKTAVDLAAEQDEFRLRKGTFTSHIALVTGLSRKEVHRLRSEADIENVVESRHGSTATRVLDAWANDPRYRGPDGEPLEILPLKSDRGVSFWQLATEFGADIPPATILMALAGYGTVADDGDTVRLLDRYYVPEIGSEEHVEIVGICAHDLLDTVEYNLRQDVDPSDRRLLREWFQRDIPEDQVEEAKALIRKRTMEFGAKLDEELSELADRRRREHVQYRRVGLGVFQVEE